MKRTTFPLRDFLVKNKDVNYDLASSSLRDISIIGDKDIFSSFDTGYSDEYSLELERRLVNMYEKVNDVEIVSLPGAQISNTLIFLTLFDHGDEILVESPNYKPLVRLPKQLGLKVKTIKRRYENGFDVSVDELQKSISKRTKAVVLTNPHNPSGVFLGKEKLSEIHQLLEERGIVLVVDEIFRDFFKDGNSALEVGSNVVVTSSFSKIFGMGGIRIGWVASRNEDIIQKIHSMKYHMNLLNSTLSEKMILSALDKRETLLSEIRTLAQTNLSMLIGWIEGSKHIEWAPPSGGIISFPKFKVPCTSYELAERALKEDVLVSPGGFFSEDCEDHIRLCFGMDTQKLAIGLKKLSKVMRTWD
ncbi:MAG: pyridoxal phosphate-dependent aminotransferase [Thermoplasmatota archaeon]